MEELAYCRLQIASKEIEAEGLDILNKIQKELDIEVEIYEGDFEEIAEVDSKLVKLAQVLDGCIITND